MDQSASPVKIRPPLSGAQRLLLAASAAGAVITLCWAALQVRAAKDEARQARAQQLSAPASPGLSAKVADLERRLAEEEARRRQAEKVAAIQIEEREGIIAFLRKDKTAVEERAGRAEETLKRLTSVENGPGTPPEEVAVKTPAAGKSAPKPPDITEQVAIGRAEALNMSLTQFIQDKGRTTAGRAWASRTDAERYALIKDYLVYSPPTIAEYQPDGYTFTLPDKPDSRVTITRENGTATPKVIYY